MMMMMMMMMIISSYYLHVNVPKPMVVVVVGGIYCFFLCSC